MTATIDPLTEPDPAPKPKRDRVMATVEEAIAEFQAGRFVIIFGVLTGYMTGPYPVHCAQQCPTVEPPSQSQVSTKINRRQ